MAIEFSTHLGPLEAGRSAYPSQFSGGRIGQFSGSERRVSVGPTHDALETATGLPAGAMGAEWVRDRGARFRRSYERVQNHKRDVTFGETSAVPTEAPGLD